MGCRWGCSVVLGIGTLLGCSDAETEQVGDGSSGGIESIGGSSSGESSDDGGVAAAEILCMSTLDASAYVAPAWSPAPVVGTRECPAVDDALRIELATLVISGQVTFAAKPLSPSSVWLVGRSNEGAAPVAYEEDGSFSMRVVPGRYDVVASVPGVLVPRNAIVSEDVAIDAAMELDVLVPAPLTVSGSMTLDGEDASDPYGHIFVRVSGDETREWYAHPLVSRMDRRTYSIALSPGTYDFLYSWCDPTQQDAFDLPPQSPCRDPAVLAVDGPSESPTQRSVPVASDVVVTDDRQLDLDVRTVRFSGLITLEDVSPHILALYLTNAAGAYRIGEEKTFDARVVTGTYAFYGHASAPPFDEQITLDEDTHVERTLRAVLVDVTHEQEPSLLDLVTATGEDLELSVDISPVHHLWPSVGGVLPLAGPLSVFVGHHVVAHEQAFCWPDYSGKGMIGWRILSDDLVIDAPSEIDVSPPPLARVAIDYTDLAEPENSAIALFGAADGLPPSAAFSAPGGRLLAHGLWPAGKYRVKGDVVDVVDGTTIRLVEESRTLEFELVVDGSAASSDGRIYVAPADEELVNGDPGLLRPGRYRVEFYGDDEGEVPSNIGLDLGCVSIEG